MTDLFEEKARDWDASEMKIRLASSIGSSIIDNVELHEAMSVMDFGAGTGLIASQIAPEVSQITAVDTSKAMLEKLTAKPSLKDKVKTVCRDILEEPLDERFDLIVSAMAMHHVKDTAGLMRSFYDHLNASGKVALADLDTEDGSFHQPGTEGVFHSGFDRIVLADIMQTEGFRQIEFHTAFVFKGETKDYPIFLVTASKGRRY